METAIDLIYKGIIREYRSGLSEKDRSVRQQNKFDRLKKSWESLSRDIEAYVQTSIEIGRAYAVKGNVDGVRAQRNCLVETLIEYCRELYSKDVVDLTRLSGFFKPPWLGYKIFETQYLRYILFDEIGLARYIKGKREAERKGTRAIEAGESSLDTYTRFGREFPNFLKFAEDYLEEAVEVFSENNLPIPIDTIGELVEQIEDEKTARKNRNPVRKLFDMIACRN